MPRLLPTLLACALSIGFAAPAQAQMTGNVDRLKADLHGVDLDRAVAAASALGSLKDARARDALLGALTLGAPPKLLTALIEALGLRHHQMTVEHDDTPAIRGMLHKVRHLVRVEEVE